MLLRSGAGLTVSDINKITNIPKPSCYKLINDLVKNDLLQKDKNRFILGERLKQIARLDLHDVDKIYF